MIIFEALVEGMVISDFFILVKNINKGMFDWR